MKTPRGTSESSTTSDNTTEFIDIVKKYDVVYNTHNPDYKNVEVKMKVWSQIAEEIGLSTEASKRKWKNLRDSYTKYLRSFRIGTKTSKKYQYWAHADHMEFLKPYQGPGRNSSNSNGSNGKSNDDDDPECDLGYQVLAKATTSSEEDLKITLTTNAAAVAAAAAAAAASASIAPTTTTSSVAVSTTITTATTTTAPVLPLVTTTTAAVTAAAIPPASAPPTTTSIAAGITTITPVPAAHTTKSTPSSSSSSSSSLSNSINNISNSGNTSTTSITSAFPLGPLGLPTLPNVPLPPQLAANKSLLAAALPATSIPTHLFPLPHQLTNNVGGGKTGATIAMPANSTASSVGCLIIEPQLFASADTFKKELNAPAIGLFHNITSQATATTSTSRVNPPLITKLRRVQTSPQTAAINLSFSATSSAANSTLPPPPGVAIATPAQPMLMASGLTSITMQPPPVKMRKIDQLQQQQPMQQQQQPPRSQPEVDIAAILHANRDLDANTLFFLSLARTVRTMPTKFQSLAKMRCMRIVSDIELELDSVGDCSDDCNQNNGKFSSEDSPPPPPPEGTIIVPIMPVNDAATEHFVYVMSPSRVESMIDISSDEDATLNGN